MTDDETPSQHDCQCCHGTGEFVCVDGCHTLECDECDGSGRLWPDDSPVPASQVEI